MVCKMYLVNQIKSKIKSKIFVSNKTAHNSNRLVTQIKV